MNSVSPTRGHDESSANCCGTSLPMCRYWLHIGHKKYKSLGRLIVGKVFAQIATEGDKSSLDAAAGSDVVGQLSGKVTKKRSMSSTYTCGLLKWWTLVAQSEECS